MPLAVSASSDGSLKICNVNRASGRQRVVQCTIYTVNVEPVDIQVSQQLPVLHPKNTKKNTNNHTNDEKQQDVIIEDEISNLYFNNTFTPSVFYSYIVFR